MISQKDSAERRFTTVQENFPSCCNNLGVQLSNHYKSRNSEEDWIEISQLDDENSWKTKLELAQGLDFTNEFRFSNKSRRCSHSLV